MVSATATAPTPTAPPISNGSSTAASDLSASFQQGEKLINEEFKVWKMTSPMLYDLMYTYSFKWQSLTVQWLRHLTPVSKGMVEAQFILGTNTGGEEQNYLRLYGVDLPSALDGTSETSQGDLSLDKSTLRLKREWKHPGEINKARIDETANLVATQTNCGDVLVYNCASDSDSPECSLKFHTKEGFGLEWNPHRTGVLASGNEDWKISLWNLHGVADKSSLKPARTIATHQGIVNDLSWNGTSPDLLASVSDDKSLQVHDLRQPVDKVAIEVANAHAGSAVNAVEFHPQISSLLATGSHDNFIQCWDLRDYTKPIRRLYGHAGPVLNMKFNGNQLLSTSTDRRVLIWDLTAIGEGKFDLKEYEKKDSDYVDPCLKFMHGGHTSALCEADWHPSLNNVVISCGEDDLVEIWKPRE